MASRVLGGGPHDAMPAAPYRRVCARAGRCQCLSLRHSYFLTGLGFFAAGAGISMSPAFASAPA